MSSADGSPWERAADARREWQVLDGEVNRVRTVRATCTDALSQAAREDATGVSRDAINRTRRALHRVGGGTADRRSAVSYLAEPLFADGRDCFDEFRRGNAIESRLDAFVGSLARYADSEDDVPPGKAWRSVIDTYKKLFATEGDQGGSHRDTFDQLESFFELATEAALRARDGREKSLSEALDEAYSSGSDPIASLAEQPIALFPVRLETRFVDPETGRPPATDGDGNASGPEELRVRVFPDQIHLDSHEVELTEEEVEWGRRFWGTLWFAHHADPSRVSLEHEDTDYLKEHIPNAPAVRRHVAALAAEMAGDRFTKPFDDSLLEESFDALGVDSLAESIQMTDEGLVWTAPKPPWDRMFNRRLYDELAERSWTQVVDRFGRERGTYVVRATAPVDEGVDGSLLTGPVRVPKAIALEPYYDASNVVDPGLNRTIYTVDDDLQLVGIGDSDGTAEEETEETIEEETDRIDWRYSISHSTWIDSIPVLEFSDPPLRPNSWTKPARATMLPDRWIAELTWETGEGENRRTRRRRIAAENPVADPLLVAPDVERDGAIETPSESSASGDVDDSEDEEDGADSAFPAWMTDFGTAEDVGMALRIPLDESAFPGFDPTRGFSSLAVFGVKASMRSDETLDAVTRHFDAHQYTDGFSFLPQGTPTNPDRAEAAELVESRFPTPFTNRAESSNGVDNPAIPTDGARLAEVLGLLPTSDRTAGDEEAEESDETDVDPETNPFEYVPHADGTEGTDAHHANSALWPATIGYSLMNVLVPKSLTDGPLGEQDEGELRAHVQRFEELRDHFVRYVRGRGPHSAIRVGRQPYGVLPTMSVLARDEPSDGEGGPASIRDGLVADLQNGVLTVDEAVFFEEVSMDQLVKGVPVETLLNAGASPGRLYRHGVSASDLVEAEVDAPTLLASRVPLVELTDIDGVELPALDPDDVSGLGGGPLDPRGTGSGINVGSGGFLGGPTSGDGPTAEDSEDREDSTAEDEEPTKPVSEVITEYLGVFTGIWEDALAASSTFGDRTSDAGDGSGTLTAQKLLEILARTGRSRDIRLSTIFELGAEDGSLPDEFDELGIDPAVTDLTARPPDTITDMFGVTWVVDDWTRILDSSDLVDDDVGSFIELLVGLARDVDKEPNGVERLFSLVDVPDIPNEVVREEFESEDEEERREKVLRAFVDPAQREEYNGLWKFLRQRLLVSERSVRGNQEQTNQRARLDEYFAHRIELYEEYGDFGFPWSALRSFLLFGLLWAFLCARLRLGIRHDDLPQAGPEIARHESPKSIYDELFGDAPSSLTRSHPDLGGDTYAEALRKAAVTYDEHSIDPRLSEFVASLEYLAGKEPSELEDLFLETLDVSSHRLDAWWTSLATRRLDELRAWQGQQLPEPSAPPNWAGDPDGGSSASEEEGEEEPSSSTTSGGGNILVGGGIFIGNDEPLAVDLGDATAWWEPSDTPAVIDTGVLDILTGPPGLYVGAYGFVEDLSRDISKDGNVATTPEFVHTPSPQQATTAALLRSAFQARDPERDGAPLAIDLSAERVRRARRIIDGVRQGQPLGEILGYRFERRLHERTADPAPGQEEPNLMQYKHAFRVKFPSVERAVLPDDPANLTQYEERAAQSAMSDVVDGYQLLRAWDEEEKWNKQEAHREEDHYYLPLPDGVTPPDEAAVRDIDDVVAELRNSVDAVGDLLLAESVHQLGQGNFDRAGGSVAALARGEVFPEPTVVDTPRAETNISHRQCVLLDPATAAGTEGTDSEVRPRAAAEPALNAWLGDLFVPFDRVGCRVEYRWTETTSAGEEGATDGSETAVDRTQETAMTLDELGLCPLDFLALSGDGEAEQAELEQRLTYRFVRARPDGVPSDATLALSLREFSPPATASVADLLEHARSLRALVLASRPLRADDLSHPSDGSEPGWDEETIADLERRGDKASTSFAEVAEALENRLELLDPPIPEADETELEEQDASAATGETTPEPSSERVPAWRTVVGGVDRPLHVGGRAEMLPQPVMAEWWRDRNLASVADRIGAYARSLDLGLTSESDPVPLTTQVDLLVTSARAFAEEASLEAVTSVLEDLDSGAEPFGAFAALADAIPLTADDPEPIDGPVVRPEAEQIITGRLGEPIAVLDEADEESDPDDDPGSGTPGSVGGALGGLGGPSGIGGLAGGRLGSPGDPLGSGGLRGGINVGGGGTGGAGTGRTRDPGLPNNFGVVLPGGGIDPVFDPEDYNLLRRRLVSEKPVDVSVWGTTGTEWFELAPEGPVTADADGEFSATFDFSTVEPGARFTVAARLKGEPEVLYSRHGRVGAADPTAEGEDLVERLGDALRPLSVLLWLSKHGDAFDTAASGPAAALREAVVAVDWATVRAEFGRMTAEDNAFSGTDRTAVEALVGLESTDVEGLESVVEATVDPVERVGLRDALTVTGDSPAADDLRTWYRQTGDAWKLRTRLRRVADDPGLLDVVTPGTPLEYAPASGAAVSGIGGSVAEHLERLLEAPAWLVRYLGETVDRPDDLMRDVLKWLYHPELVTDTDALADRVLALADGLDAQPALYELFAPEPAGFPPEAGATADDGAGGGAEGTVTVEEADRRDRLEAVASELRALASVVRASSAGGAGGGGGSGSYVATWNDAVASGTEVFRRERRRIGAIRTGVQPDEAFRRGMLETVRTRLVRASAFGVYGSTPQSPSGGDPSDESTLVEQTRAVRARIAARLEGVEALDDQLEAMDANPSPERVEALVARLEAIFGDSFVALPSFVPTNGPELGASFRNRGLLPEGAELAPETFLHRIAQVRERPADFREAYSYAEALTGRLHRRLRVAQLPHREDDTWVGADVEGVTPTPGTLSILAQFGSTPENPDENGDLYPFGAGSRVTGVFVDEWVEAVPAATETTGVALNYDDPGARPPQSILLAVPPEDGEWSLVDLGAVIDETRRFVSLRAVDVGDLRESGSGGGLVPALYLPFGSGPEETRRAPTYADTREWPRPTPAPSAEPNPGENEEDEEDEEDDQ